MGQGAGGQDQGGVLLKSLVQVQPRGGEMLPAASNEEAVEGGASAISAGGPTAAEAVGEVVEGLQMKMVDDVLPKLSELDGRFISEEVLGSPPVAEQGEAAQRCLFMNEDFLPLKLVPLPRFGVLKEQHSCLPFAGWQDNVSSSQEEHLPRPEETAEAHGAEPGQAMPLPFTQHTAEG